MLKVMHHQIKLFFDFSIIPLVLALRGSSKLSVCICSISSCCANLQGDRLVGVCPWSPKALWIENWTVHAKTHVSMMWLIVSSCQSHRGNESWCGKPQWESPESQPQEEKALKRPLLFPKKISVWSHHLSRKFLWIIVETPLVYVLLTLIAFVYLIWTIYLRLKG